MGLEANTAARARIIAQERYGGLTPCLHWLVRRYQVTPSRDALIRLPNAMVQTLRYCISRGPAPISRLESAPARTSCFSLSCDRRSVQRDWLPCWCKSDPSLPCALGYGWITGRCGLHLSTAPTGRSPSLHVGPERGIGALRCLRIYAVRGQREFSGVE